MSILPVLPRVFTLQSGEPSPEQKVVSALLVVRAETQQTHGERLPVGTFSVCGRVCIVIYGWRVRMGQSVKHTQ